MRARKTARETARAALSQTSESERRSIEAVGLKAARRELREEVRGVRRRRRDQHPDRAGDRSGRCAARGARAAVRGVAAFVALLRGGVIVRMRGVVMAVDAVLIVVRLRGAILVMAECHALPCRDRRHALDRDGEGQQKDRKKSEESVRHRHAFYVNCLERGPPRRFPRTAHLLRAMPIFRDTLHALSMMVRMNDRMALAARDQPAIHRKRGDRGHGEGKCQTAPEQQ